MALETVGAASAIAALTELTIKVTGYVKDVRDADKQIEDYNREAASLVNLLSSLRARVTQNGENTGDPWFDSVRMLQHGPMQQYQIALEAFASKVAPRPGRRGKIFHRLLWTFNKRDVQDLLAKMERLSGLISIALQMDHFKLSQRIGDSVENVQVDTTAIRAASEMTKVDLDAMKSDSQAQAALSLDILQDTSQISSLHSEVVSRNEMQRKSDEVQRKKAIMEWLSDQDYAEQQHDNISQYSEGTCVWVLEHPNFRKWEQGTCDTLFCVGMPGAGKTVTSAMVIRHLTQSFRSSDMKIAVAFLYLRYDRRDAQSTERLIGSLIRQLISQTSETPSEIEEAFDKHRISGASPNRRMLLAAVKCFKRVYFVVDALDEGEDLATRELLAAIRSLPDDAKFFATSRFDSAIQAQFRNDSHLHIRGSDRDIRNYTAARLRELPGCVENNLELQGQIIQAITASTEGMFLLAKLNVDSLRGKRSVKAVKTMLQELPSGSNAYDTAYKLAMDRIADQSQDDRRLAQTVLTWVIHARQTLTEVDLETALAVEVGRWILDPENIIPTVDLLSLCAGLVAMDESKTIRLVHYTAKQYFQRNPHRLLDDPHLNLSEVCLSYLGLDIFMSSEFIDDADRPHLSSHVAQHPFLSYAAAHWSSHLKDHEAQTQSTDKKKTNSRIMPLLLRLLRHNDLMISYFRARGSWTLVWEDALILPVRKFIFQTMTGLQYAASYEGYEVVSALLELGVDVNEERYGTTALIEAAREVREPIVKLLLEAKADVHRQHQDHHTALTTALGMYTKRQMLSYAFVHFINDNNSFLLEARKSIVDLLLEAGSDPDHTTSRFRNMTPLMCAAQSNIGWAVSKLCSAGADVDWRDNDKATALHLAAELRHEEVVGTLLRFGADPLLGISGHLSAATTTPLVRNCHILIVRQLLLHIGESRLPRTTSASAVHGAAPFDYESIVKLLLLHGIDPKLEDQRSGTSALRLAAEKGHISTISTLLAHDVDQGLADHGSQAALHLAADSGKKDIVKDHVVNELSYCDCDAEGADTSGPNDLLTAAAEASSTYSDEFTDSEEDADALGADPDFHSEDIDILREVELGPVILRLACMKSSSDLLIERWREMRPQEIDLDNGELLIALIHETKAVNAAVIFLLLEADDLVLSGQNGYTAFHILAGTESFEDPGEKVVVDIMRKLLRATVPIDVDIRTSDGGTPLMFAACAGHNQRVKLLLDEGADVLAKDNAGWSALTHAAFGGDEETVKCLRDAGADPQNDLALLCAACWGNPFILHAIMDENTDFEMVFANGRTALMSAAEKGHLGVVAILIGTGVRVNAVTADGSSALHFAASGGFEQITRLLLDAGASVSMSNDFGETPLDSILKYGYRNCWNRGDDLSEAEAVLRMLLEAGADVDLGCTITGLPFLGDLPEEPVGKSKFLIDAGYARITSDPDDVAGYSTSPFLEHDLQSIDLRAMELLLHAGADLNQVDAHGDTALMRSCRSCELRKIHLLLANGATTGTANHLGETALSIALISGCGLGVLKELLVAGADPSQEVAGRKSVMFHLISRNGLPYGDDELDEIVEAMIVAGADPNTVHENGDTLLLQAARSGRLAVKFLLESGADMRASDRHGRNAIMLASMLDNDQGAEALQLLLDAGVDPRGRDCNNDTALMLAARSHYSPITLGTLLNAGLDADEYDVYGNTALMAVAYRSGEPESEARICSLIEAGVSLDAVDKEGNTALIIAAEHGYSIMALLEAGCDPNAANGYGETALMKCFSHPRRACEKVQALLDAGAEVNMLDRRRRNALIWAASRRELSEDLGAVRLLLSAGISIDNEDEDGATAHACAELAGNVQTANWIRKEMRKRVSQRRSRQKDGKTLRIPQND